MNWEGHGGKLNDECMLDDENNDEQLFEIINCLGAEPTNNPTSNPTSNPIMNYPISTTEIITTAPPTSNPTMNPISTKNATEIITYTTENTLNKSQGMKVFIYHLYILPVISALFIIYLSQV